MSATPIVYPAEYVDLFPSADTSVTLGSLSANVNVSQLLKKIRAPAALTSVSFTQNGLDDSSVYAEASFKHKNNSLLLSSLVRCSENSSSGSACTKNSASSSTCGVCCAAKYLPNISYTFAPGWKGFQRFTASASIADQTVGVDVQEPAYRWSAVVKVLDGFASDVAASTRLVENAYGGLAFSYDPSRSGLKHYSYSLLFQNRPEIRSGSALFTFDAVRGLGASARVPLRENKESVNAIVTVTPASNEVVLGADLRCPTGASQVIATVNVLKQAFQLSGWKSLPIIAQGLRVHFGLESSLRQPKPKLGLHLSYE